MKIKQSHDTFVKGSDNKSAISLKNATIALLIGGAAVLGSYMIQPTVDKASQETTTLAAGNDEQTTILGLANKDEEEIIQTNIAFEDTRPTMDLSLPIMDIDHMLEV